jgi:hypothetical protein
LGPLALDILPNINNIENFRRVGPETKAVVLAPTRTDPLAIATSDVVLGLAEAEHVNAAVLPPDDCEDWCYRVGRSGKVSLAALAQEAAYSKELELAEEKGWLVGAPTDPLETTWERLSRPALEELLNAIESTRTVPIDALARFEMQAGPDSNKVLASTSTMALHNWTFYDLLPNGDLGAEPCLALLGTLNDDQRQRAAQGTLKVDPTQLSKEQVAYLHDWLLAYGQKFMPKAPGVDFAEAWKTLDGRGEPTEVLGSGLPAGSYLELIDRTKLDFTIKRTQDSYGCDLDGLAQLSAKAERPELFPTIVDYHLDSIWAGTERNLVMRFVVGNRSEDQAFSERHSPNRRTPGQTIPEILDQLSPDVRITYTRALEKYRSEFARKKPR